MLDLTRRDFMKTTGAALGAAALPTLATTAQANPTAGKDELRVLSIGVGGMGGADRREVNNHPKARIVGLCDVDTQRLEAAKKQHPDAFAEKDYRKIFADRADQFDAVIVSTPDHHHAPQMMTALLHNKHVYGQKPLVQQLAELPMMEQAIAARPHLVTQVGNQRMKEPGRRVAVDILRKNLLGKVKEAYVTTGAREGRHIRPDMPPEKEAPAHLDWDLWLGPCEVKPYRDGKAHFNWRKWWDHGTGGMGDWGVHLLDIIMYSFPELTSPISVKTQTPRGADWYHTSHCQSTMVYEVNSDRFASSLFPVHYSDSSLLHSMRALGIGLDKWPGGNMTVVACEGGTLMLDAGGKHVQVWRKGEQTKGWDVEGVDRPRPFNHWHVWVDKALGDKDAPVWTPFEQAIRITEAAILPVKASRFPNTELFWDRKNLTFTNHQQATDTVVRRNYRDGFAPPDVKKFSNQA